MMGWLQFQYHSPKMNCQHTGGMLSLPVPSTVCDVVAVRLRARGSGLVLLLRQVEGFLVQLYRRLRKYACVDLEWGC